LLAGVYLVVARPGDPGLIFVAILSMGVAGLVGVFCVVRWLLIRPASSWNATVVLILICLGCVPVLMYMPRGWHTLDRLVFSLPLICTVHLGYLARDYFVRIVIFVGALRCSCRLTSSCSGRSCIKCQGTWLIAPPLNCGVTTASAN